MSELKSYTVYYIHTLDERGALPNWKACKDYVCCVNADSVEEAIEKAKSIALNQYGAAYIKVLGIGHSKPEWVDETSPSVTDEKFYQDQIKALFERIALGRKVDPNGPSTSKLSIQQHIHESKYGKNGYRS